MTQTLNHDKICITTWELGNATSSIPKCGNEERWTMKALFISITLYYFAGCDKFDCVAVMSISSQTCQEILTILTCMYQFPT